MGDPEPHRMQQPRRANGPEGRETTGDDDEREGWLVRRRGLTSVRPGSRGRLSTPLGWWVGDARRGPAGHTRRDRLVQVLGLGAFPEQPRWTGRPQAVEGPFGEVRREINHRNVERHPDVGAGLQAVHEAWQPEVHDDHVWPQRGREVEGLMAGRGEGQHGVAHLGEALLQVEGVGAVGTRKENAFCPHRHTSEYGDSSIQGGEETPASPGPWS
jgi:hypothetical protein